VTIGDRAIQPWDVQDAVEQLAKIWSLQVQDVEERLAVNLRTLIGST
jgi:Tat protein secretion system quality control protein TatD with DNase activity